MSRFPIINPDSPSGMIWSDGKDLGCKYKNGYWYFKYKGARFKTSRYVAFLSGKLTKDELLSRDKIVDHIDGDKDNNHPENLKVGTQRDNTSNMKCHREGKLVGACYNKRRGKWQSQINIQGKLLFLGYFKTEALAHEAYLKAKEEIDGN